MLLPSLLMPTPRQTHANLLRRAIALVAMIAVFVGASAALGQMTVGGEEFYAEGILVDNWNTDVQPGTSRRGGCGWLRCRHGCNLTHGCNLRSPRLLQCLQDQCMAHGLVLHERLTELAVETRLDYGDFYSRRGLALQGVGLGVAAIMANTSIDQQFQDWHDTHVKGETSDDLSGAFKWLGEGYITIPICAGAALLSVASVDTNEPIGAIGEWGGRCIRGYAVGGPSLLVLKYLLNGSRPEDEIGSTWRFFGDPRSGGAVSGHAFVGAMPFLTAARMTDNCILKAGFYTLSTLPAWSRINDRMHFLSQAMFGWWLAWVAVDVVHRTELFQNNFVVLPLASAEGAGIQAVWRW